MSFTRKFLKSLGIEEDKVEAIMEAHTEVVDGLKKERDGYKTDADKLPGVQHELEEAQKKTGNGEDYKKKYEDLVAEQAAAKTRTQKTAIFRKLAQDAGVAEKYLDTVIRASGAEIDKLELDGESAKDAEGVTAGLKTAWADFIPVRRDKNPHTENPPKNTGGKPTRDEIMAIKDDTERQQAIAENMELFQ